MAVSPELIAALRRLNPSTPADDDSFVPREWAGMTRGWDVQERLELLLAAGQPVRWALHGAIGVGKTTELRRIARALQGQAEVVWVEFSDDWDSERLHELVGARIGKHLGVEVGLRDGANGLRLRDPGSLGTVADQLDQIHAATLRAPILILDGFERADGEDVLGEDGVAEALREASYLLVAPHPWVVFSSREQRSRSLDAVIELPAFAVQGPDGQPNEDAIRPLAEGLRRRLGEAASAFLDPIDAVRRAAFYSGGLPRDAVRILHGAVLAAARSGRVNAQHVSVGVSELRQDLAQSLQTGELEQLRAIARTGRHEGGEGLIQRNLILSYAQAQELTYWQPHPALRAMLPLPDLG